MTIFCHATVIFFCVGFACVQCVIYLTVQFFIIYVGLRFAQTAKDFFISELIWRTEMMEDAKGTMLFPPFAILFAGTRMMALQITNSNGAPQGWVQDGKYMATWAKHIQFLFLHQCANAHASDGHGQWCRVDGRRIASS